MTDKDFKSVLSEIEVPVMLKESVKQAVDTSYSREHKYKFKSKKLWASSIASVLIICLAITGVAISIKGRNINYNDFAISTATDMVKISGSQHAKNLQANNIKLDDTVQAQLNDSLFKLSEATLLSNEDNSVFSPFAVYFMIGILQEMANGETKQQLVDWLGAGAQSDETYKLIYNYFCQNTDEARLLINNSAWFNNLKNYNQPAAERLAINYKADIFNGNFNKPVMGKSIRSWLSDNSDGKFGTKNDIGEMESVLKLFSLIDFSASWDKSNLEETTLKFSAHPNEGSKIANALLYKSTGKVFYESANYTSAKVNMLGNYNLVLIKPNGNNTISDILNKGLLQEAATFSLQENLVDGNLVCKFPTFSITSNQDMKKIISNFGVTDIFCADKANLNNFAAGNLYVSNFVTKAFISLDKSGANAGSLLVDDKAPTNVHFNQNQTLQFELDKPFIYAIMRNNVPIFTGAVQNI
ncbi:MAG: serpin family protein [Clostridia bacterium]